MGTLGFREENCCNWRVQSGPYNLWTMQSNGPCSTKGLMGSMGIKSMPRSEALVRREGWIKLCPFLGARA